MISCKKAELKFLQFLFVKTIYNACAILVVLIAKEKNLGTERLYHGFHRIIKINEFLNMEQTIDQAKRQDLLSDICIPKPDNYTEDFTTPPTELETSIQQTVKQLFIDSYTAYNNAITENKQNTELQKLARLHLSEHKAEDIAMIIDSEPSVNADTLNKIVADKVAEQLAKELKKLKFDQNKSNKNSQDKSQADTNDKKTDAKKNKKNSSNQQRVSNKSIIPPMIHHRQKTTTGGHPAPRQQRKQKILKTSETTLHQNESERNRTTHQRRKRQTTTKTTTTNRTNRPIYLLSIWFLLTS